MKLNEMAVAHASGILGAIFFLACYILVIFAPEVYRVTAQSWVHGVDLSLIWRPRAGNFILGLLTFSLVSWVSGWVFAWLYNKLIKQ